MRVFWTEVKGTEDMTPFGVVGKRGLKIKGDTFFVLAINAYRGSKGIAPFILNIGTRGGEELTPGSGPFMPGKYPDTRSVGVGVGPRVRLDVFLKS